jgi:N-methylhydantoinase A
MLGALRLISVQQGFDPRDFALMSFGGAGPLHANALGRLTGAWPVIVPPSPGVACAYGDATTCARDESARTMVRRFSTLDDTELRAVLAELADQAAARLESEGVPRESQTATYQIDLRYHGQGFEIPVEIDRESMAGDLLAELGARFDAEHKRLFSFLLDNEREVITLRVTVSGPRPEVAWRTLPEGDGDPSAALLRETEVWMDGASVPAGIFDRSKLRAGDVVAGPAVVVEMDSTTLVLPGHAATVHPSGSLLIRPTEEG